jgi:glycosyltransferase involved in cell wall biosynthesis
MGIFGELKPKKRVPFWLSALRDRGLLDRISLLVVGRADEETEGILADPALTPHVHRVSFLPPEDLPGYYAACDYLARPSMFEGLPNVLLEAMACGVVPVCSETGGMPDVVEDGGTGFLFPPENRDQAGLAMVRALELSPEELQEMGTRVREHVRENFSEDRELDCLEELLSQLHGGSLEVSGGQG